MTTFLATLSADHIDNWRICKRESLWGTGTSNHAKAAAKRVRPGDPIVVWTSTKGVTALARVTGPAQEVNPRTFVPWPEPQRYSYVFPIEVIEELPDPEPDSFRKMVSVRFGIKTHYLQAGFIAVPEEVGTRLLNVFSPLPGQTPDAAEERPDPAPAEHVLAGAYLTESSSPAEVLLALYRRAAADPQAEMLVIGQESDREAVRVELEQEPFTSIKDRIRFVTTAELAAELEARLR